jgi:hypothetical protein
VVIFVDILVLVSIVTGLLSVAGLPVALRSRLIQTGWKRAAQRLGLEFIAGQIGESDEISGSVTGFPVSISNQHRQRTRIVLSAKPIPESMRLRRTMLFSDWSLDELLLTGDAEFDRTITPRGRSIDVMPWLDRATRRLLVDIMLRHNFVVADRAIVFEYPAVLRMEKQIEAITRDLALVAGALSSSRSTAEKLRANACDLAEPALFRRRNLELLIAHHPHGDQTIAACRSAILSMDPEERLIGAIGLENEREGLDVTRTLASDETIGNQLRIRALQHLVVFLDEAALERVLIEMAKSTHDHVRARVAVAARERHIIEMAPRLLAMIEGEHVTPQLGTVVVQALAVLGSRGDQRIERALIALCLHEHDEIKRASAAALGRIGTLAAVEPLLQLTKALLGDHTLKRIARESVQTIRAEHPRAEPGVLSLVEGGPIGELSLALTGTLGVTGSDRDRHRDSDRDWES